MVLLVLILSFLIGIAYLVLIRSFDRYEKDSLLKLIISFIIGGLISVIITTLIYSQVQVEETFFDAIFKVGAIEEFSKMLGFLAIFLLFRKSINEIVDGLIYISAVALGFACIENVFYALSATEPIMLLMQRSIYAVAGHLSFAGYMGIALFINFKRKSNFPGIILAFVLAALAHGLYDGVLFEHYLNELFHYIFILLVAAHIGLYRVVLSFSRFRPLITEDLFEAASTSEEKYCGKCQRTSECTGLQYHKIHTYSCNTCKHLNFSMDGWIELNKFFRPIINARRYGRFLRSEYNNRGRVALDSGKDIIYNSDNMTVSAKVDILRVWINSHNRGDQLSILKTPVLGMLLKLIGLRYLVSIED